MDFAHAVGLAVRLMSEGMHKHRDKLHRYEFLARHARMTDDEMGQMQYHREEIARIQAAITALGDALNREMGTRNDT